MTLEGNQRHGRRLFISDICTFLSGRFGLFTAEGVVLTITCCILHLTVALLDRLMIMQSGPTGWTS